MSSADNLDAQITPSAGPVCCLPPGWAPQQMVIILREGGTYWRSRHLSRVGVLLENPIGNWNIVRALATQLARVMGPTRGPIWVLSAPGGPHVGPIRGDSLWKAIRSPSLDRHTGYLAQSISDTVRFCGTTLYFTHSLISTPFFKNLGSVGAVLPVLPQADCWISRHLLNVCIGEFIQKFCA